MGTKHIFAGSSRIASQHGLDILYYHTDHLGSSTVETDGSGNKVQENSYYPFGETKLGDNYLTHYKYTGQEEDPETGLYYYGARYYDPVIGRFVSADSVMQSYSIPQSLNRYSYCLNNPLRYTDPTGHFVFGKFLKSVISGVVAGAVFAITKNPALAGMAAGVTAGAETGNPGNAIIGGMTGGVLGGIGGAVYSTYGATGIYVMLGVGGVAAIATDGLNGLAYYAGGLVGGVIGYGATDYAKTNWDKWFGQSVAGSEGRNNEALSVAKVREILEADEKKQMLADKYFEENKRVEMFRLDDPGGARYGKINEICSQSGVCGHPFDLAVGSKNAIKFATNTLHIRHYADKIGDYLMYHWDRFNIHVNFWKHIWVDSIGDFLHGGGW